MILNFAHFFKAAGVAAIVVLVSCGPQLSSGSDGMQSALDDLMLEKTRLGGLYRAASQQAEKEGKTEIATYFGELAQEEQAQVVKISYLQAVVKKNTNKNIAELLAIEKFDAKTKDALLIDMAKQERNGPLEALLIQIQADDQRHSLGLKGLLEKVK